MKPMGLRKSLLFFGIPTFLMTVIFWKFLPLLDQLGKRLFFTFTITMVFAFTLMFLAALRFYRKERSGLSLQERFRLQPMNRKDWLWTLVLAVILFGGNAALSFTSDWMAKWIAYTKLYVRLMDSDPNYFMEVGIRGNGFVIIGFLLFCIVNVLGEEFWWRGYIFPRQELAFGRWTWLVHGSFWTLFHIFLPWNLISYIPGTLALSYTAQKLRKTGPCIVAHFAQNIPVLVQLIGGYFGR